jgi:hypothetical protein
MGLQKYTHEMEAMRCYIGFDAWEFVKYWQDGFTKIHA